MHFNFHYTIKLAIFLTLPLHSTENFLPPPPSGNSKLFWPLHFAHPPHQGILVHFISLHIAVIIARALMNMKSVSDITNASSELEYGTRKKHHKIDAGLLASLLV